MPGIFHPVGFIERLADNANLRCAKATPVLPAQIPHHRPLFVDVMYQTHHDLLRRIHLRSDWQVVLHVGQVRQTGLAVDAEIVFSFAVPGHARASLVCQLHQQT
ncbi:hypothetical protein D3C81_1859270 [compost metagenome]